MVGCRLLAALAYSRRLCPATFATLKEPAQRLWLVLGLLWGLPRSLSTALHLIIELFRDNGLVLPLIYSPL